MSVHTEPAFAACVFTAASRTPFVSRYQTTPIRQEGVGSLVLSVILPVWPVLSGLIGQPLLHSESP